MSSLYRLFQSLIPQPPLQVGTVTSVTSGVATVQLPGGNYLTARGTATVGQSVYVRDGRIDGTAQQLAVELIEV